MKICQLVFLFFTLYSCQYETNNETTHIQYRVTVEDFILDKVVYRSANDTIISVDSLADMEMWYTTEFVNDDFEAHLKATFVNTDTIDKSYKLHCFVGGKLVSVKEGVVAPLTGKSEEINYSFRN